MKRIFVAVVFCGVVLLLFSNCKREKTPTKQPPPNPSDSADYIGTRFHFTVPFRFPDIAPNMVNDTGTMTVEGIQLGRMMFYDKHMSLDGHKACASCHIQKYAFSDAGHVLSTNEFGFTKRNAPTIQNLAFQPYFFWDGRQPTLIAQAGDASQHELGMIAVNFISYLQADTTYSKLFKKAFGHAGANITEAMVFNALQQFEMTLISNNSTFDKVIVQQGGTFAPGSPELAGLTLFQNESGDCFHCHESGGGSTLLFTDNLFRNNGLDSSSTFTGFPDLGRGAIDGVPDDNGKFKDPTLRNIALSSPYMRDGRYQTLTQVVNFYSDSTKLSPTIDPLMTLPNHHGGKGIEINAEQVAAIVAFLNTLTDTSFINNPAFSDPFKH